MGWSAFREGYEDGNLKIAKLKIATYSEKSRFRRFVGEGPRFMKENLQIDAT